MIPEKLTLSGAVVISIIIVLGFLGAAGLVFWLQTENQPVKTLLDTLTVQFVAVVNYWLGSSAGSKRKDEHINALSQTIATLPVAPAAQPASSTQPTAP